MTPAPRCPRCHGPVRPPDLMSSRWRCEHDGAVEPLHLLAPAGPDTLEHVAAQAAVPLWVPWPPPVGWTLGGVAHAGDERTGARATASAWCGPSPVGGAAELLLVSEEPLVGLGASYAGWRGVDAGDCVSGPPHAKVEVHGHPVALWQCDGVPADRAAFVGEADGRWLWLVVWPGESHLLLLEGLLLCDARGGRYEPLLGAPSQRLAAP